MATIVGMFGHGDSVKRICCITTMRCLARLPAWGPNLRTPHPSPPRPAPCPAPCPATRPPTRPAYRPPVSSLDTLYEVQARRPLTVLFSISV